MSKFLVINTGSTSLKYKFFDEKHKVIHEESFTDVLDHEKVIKKILREIGNVSDISAVGHRVVHGGEDFVEPVVVDQTVLEKMKDLNDLAPLHNPHNILGIEILSEFLPEVPQVAVFDTSFFADLPEVAKKYAIPEELSKKYKIKRYGFHGISHKCLTEKSAEQLNKKPDKTNLITCHLGGGWSVSAIKNGRPIDISMGYTPLEGLVMMTRAGDIGPGVIFEILREGIGANINDIDDLYDILNHNSGIKGLSGGISSYRELLKEMNLGNQKAKLAFDLAVYRLSKYIGAYFVALGGSVDAIVFSGGVGSGDPITRYEVKKKIKSLGKIKTLAIETDEELMIAKELDKLIK